MHRRTGAAPAQWSAPHSSARRRAAGRRSGARWTGSVPVRAPAPARNVLIPRSPNCSLRIALRGRGRGLGAIGSLGAVIILPVPLLLQGIGNVLGHVGFVVLGE